MSAKVFTIDEAKAAKFDLIENAKGGQAVHDTVVAMRAARRSGTASVKTKATVNLSGAKPWRLKGTGRARAGYKASPVWVEPAIAASIAVTALLNIFPVTVLRPERLALVFGLVHGYGFAGLLIEAAAPAGLLPWALAGFNLGVEAGQLTAVTGWVLLSQLLVRQPWYGRVVVRGGSWLLVLLAGYWFWQRVF